MNAASTRFAVPATLLLVLSACAGNPGKVEDPHHYSRDRDGNRMACYTTETANEYECVPLVRYHPRYAYHDPLWDPWWPYGYGYSGWGHPPVVYYPYPYPERTHPSRRPRR